MKFYWPFETNIESDDISTSKNKHGKYLLYLIEKPIVSVLALGHTFGLEVTCQGTTCFFHCLEKTLFFYQKKIPNDHPIELRCDGTAGTVDTLNIQVWETKQLTWQYFFFFFLI
jgi:hypothetical protein